MDDFLQNHVNDATAMIIIGQNRKRQQLQFRLGEGVYIMYPKTSSPKTAKINWSPFLTALLK